MNKQAAKSKFVAQSRPTLYYLNMQGDKLETSAKLRAFVIVALI